MSHINELIDFVATAFIVNKDRVLLIHHKKQNLWLPIGGHIELNEDPEEALFREVKEECGLVVEILGEKPEIKQEGFKSLYAPQFLDIHKISGDHRHISLTYFARAKSDKIKLADAEHNEIRWFTKDELDDPSLNLIADVKFYAMEALKAVGGTGL